MIVGFLFGGWDVTDRFEQAAMVVPVHVFEGGVLDVVEVPPWSPIVDQLRFVQSDHRLGQGVDAPIVQIFVV